MEYIPTDYASKLSVKETQIAIKFVKDTFQKELAKALNLTRVSSPLFVARNSGLNDNLNGVERAVSFDILETGEIAEVVHSLAKWKRLALAKYGFSMHEGLYTDMNAIRRDETCDNLHSLYVDQWDWEKIISEEDRTTDYLYSTVKDIFAALKKTAVAVKEKYPQIDIPFIDKEITFYTTGQLEDEYPDLTPEQREYAAAKKCGAVFVSQIGGKLKSGIKHGGRAPDYDDWTLNGDIIIYYPVIDCALEISSMGVRVDKTALKKQLREENLLERLELPFHSALMKDELPLTIGGGIGQSRICMLLLEKAHIGEVQTSMWPKSTYEYCKKHNISIL